MDNDLKIAIAQINITSGDIKNNAIKIAQHIKRAENEKIDLIIFPELALTGNIGSAINRFPTIIDNCQKWMEELAKTTTLTTAIVGFIEKENESYYNSVAILKDKKIFKIIRNNNFDTSSGFTDYKYFKPFKTSDNILKIKDNNCRIFIGHDYQNSKIENNDIIINCISKPNITNLPHIKTNNTTIFVNRCGNIDNIAFDGNSCVYQNKKLVLKAKLFEEDFLTVNPNNKNPEIKNNSHKEDVFDLNYENCLEYTYKNAIQGIKDYFEKTGFKRAVLGLSGGLDSAVCAVLLADTLGKKNVFAISMPSKITTENSKNDAKLLADNLGINFMEIPIKNVVSTISDTLNGLFEKIEDKWDNRYKKSYTNDNIQARSRALYLWGISNEFANCLPIATSDKSELYMGYATINGDMSGGYAPIGDITKTKLFALAKWINKNGKIKNVIPVSIITKPPGAELAIDETTGKPLIAEDALMPYPFLDEIIWQIENNHKTYEELLAHKFEYEKMNLVSISQKTEWLDKFYRRMSNALYKKHIMPLITNIESEPEYQQPITSSKIEYKKYSNKQIKDILKEI